MVGQKFPAQIGVRTRATGCLRRHLRVRDPASTSLTYHHLPLTDSSNPKSPRRQPFRDERKAKVDPEIAGLLKEKPSQFSKEYPKDKHRGIKIAQLENYEVSAHYINT